MGVITSRPGSRQTSPGPSAMSHMKAGSLHADEAKTVAPSAKTESTTSNTHAIAMAQRLESLQQTTSDKRMREASPAAAMITSSDDEQRHPMPGELIGDTAHPEGIAEVESEEEEQEEEDGEEGEEDAYQQVTEMTGVEGPHAFDSDSEGEYDHDLMDEIDVENIGMLESDSDSEGSPYHDPDPMCIDRLTDDETDLILDEARMHGVGYIVRKYVLSGLISAKKMLLMTIPGQIQIPASLTENDIIRTFSERLRGVLRRRKRLQNVHTIEHVVELLKTSKRIMVLTGAGVSVSCGIPDFRSEDGIYSRLSEFELDDPQQMFDLEFFRERPEIFYSFAREIFPSNFIPSPSHYFIRLLEEQGSLLRNYTQNIDTLEQKAGIQKVLQCHGSFATASCVRCGHQVQGDEIKDSIFKQEVAYCKMCRTPTPPPKAKPQKKAKARYSSSDEDESDDDDVNDPNRALMKPDIVFFGEKLPPLFDQSLKEDREKVDLLIVIGSSLKVAPVSDIMHQLPNSVPQILINRTPNYHMEFDVQLLGNCDTIVAELCRMAGWELRHQKLPGGTSNVPDMDVNTNKDGSGKRGRAAWSLLERGYYVFEGADVSERDVMALKSREARRAGEPGAAHPSLGFGDDFDTDDDDDEDEDEDDSKEAGNMEGLTADTSSRRPPRRDDRDASTGLMDVEEDHEPEEGSSDENDDAQPDSDLASFGTRPTSLAHAGAATTSSSGAAAVAVTAQGSSLVSPRLHPIGFATGTTVPRSGSINEIHHDVLSVVSRSADATASASSSSHSGSLQSPKFSSASDASRALCPEPSDDFDDDEEEVKIRVMFTEKMPKDLGEEDGGDGEVGLGLHGRGHVLLGHGRQPSVDLEPITEDKQLEVEESSVTMASAAADEDEDEEIEVGGPEGPLPDMSGVAGHGEHA
ncbi:unnamed protein product [Mortierella alpina]